jgi:hypothetical protein
MHLSSLDNPVQSSLILSTKNLGIGPPFFPIPNLMAVSSSILLEAIFLLPDGASIRFVLRGTAWNAGD